jgi:hypothetical protein
VWRDLGALIPIRPAYPLHRQTYADAADWLQRESQYLRKVALLLETASGRLSVVLTRCQAADSADVR